MGTPVKIIDAVLLATFRTAGNCELCEAFCRKREPHHLWQKGQASWSRMDIPINLAVVGFVWGCLCHTQYHTTKHVTRADFLIPVARRCRTTPERIEAVMLELRAGRLRWTAEDVPDMKHLME